MVKKTDSAPLIKNGRVYVWQGLVKAAKDEEKSVKQTLQDALTRLKDSPQSTMEQIIDYGSCLGIAERKKLETALRKAGVNDRTILQAFVLGAAIETFVQAALDAFDGLS